MFFQTISIFSQPRSNITIFHYIAFFLCGSLELSVNKADFISTFSLQSILHILGLTETWIRPEDSATPAALYNNLSFSQTPRQVGRGGGTGLLISNNWKCSTHSPQCINSVVWHLSVVW